jgi:hypothetical protein
MKLKVKKSLGRYIVELTFVGTFKTMSFYKEESANQYEKDLEDAINKHTNQRVIEELESLIESLEGVHSEYVVDKIKEQISILRYGI